MLSWLHIERLLLLPIGIYNNQPDVENYYWTIWIPLTTKTLLLKFDFLHQYKIDSQTNSWYQHESLSYPQSIWITPTSFLISIHHFLIPNKNIKIYTKETQTKFKLMDYYIVFFLVLRFVWASIHVFTSNLASRKYGLPTLPQPFAIIGNTFELGKLPPSSNYQAL